MAMEGPRMSGKTIDQISMGDSARFTKTISESDIYLYAGISGDTNPAHLDETYARGTFFKTRIAHGMLSAGLISAVLGTKLPGPGSIYLHQELSFKAPVRIGDTITAIVKVIDIDVDANRLTLETVCENQDGTCVINGKAICSPMKRSD